MIYLESIMNLFLIFSLIHSILIHDYYVLILPLIVHF